MSKAWILIIDDDEEIRAFLHELRLVSTVLPALIISDFKMPGMNGLEVVSELSRSFPQLGSILLSGEIEEDLEILTRDLGTVRVLEKPFPNERLLGMVEQMVHRPSSLPSPARTDLLPQ
jgi:CheY-like chemotaxis protein